MEKHALFEQGELFIETYFKLNIDLEFKNKLDILQEKAGFLRSSGKLKESLELYESNLIETKNHYGENHISTGHVLGNLGNIYNEFGEFEKGKKMYENCLNILNNHYGKGHYETADIIMNIGSLYN